jgi:Arc/MetJ-type ribon-helix-helix transcriptional regulator
MSQVETVATWAGLLTGVAGVVLAVVAIWFAISTERRSASVSDHTIQSLQKIESQVDRASKDTQDLIKVAWDRLVTRATGDGLPDREQAEASNLQISEVVSGLIAELKAQGVVAASKEDSEGGSDSSEASDAPRAAEALRVDLEDRFERLASEVQAAIAAQVNSGALSRSPSDAIDSAVRTLRRLPPEQLEILRTLSFRGRHLTEAQYQRLVRHPILGPALLDLRDRGLVVPLSGVENGKRVPVYWLAPGTSEYIQSAIRLVRSERSPGVRETVRRAFLVVGYLPRSTSDEGSPSPADDIGSDAESPSGGESSDDEDA